MKKCAFCNKPIVVLFHRNFHVFCDEACANKFDKAKIKPPTFNAMRPADDPFDAEEIHWCEVDGTSNGGGTP